MIEREYYPLEKAAGILSCDTSELIHLGATGQIAIHALVADLLVEPYKMVYDVPNFPFNHPLKRMPFTGLVRIDAEDILKYDANPRATVVRGVWLPSVDGQAYYAFLLEYRPDNNDLGMAMRTAKHMKDMRLVIKAEELDKAREFVRPMPEQHMQPALRTTIASDDPRRIHPQAFGVRVTVAEMRKRWGLTNDRTLEELARTGELIPLVNNLAIHVESDWDSIKFGIPCNIEKHRRGATYDLTWTNTLPDEAYYGLPFVLEYEKKYSINPQMEPAAASLATAGAGEPQAAGDGAHGAVPAPEYGPNETGQGEKVFKHKWMRRAREIGERWMLAKEREIGRRPGVEAIAKHVAGEMLRLGIKGPRGPLSAATIKREALTGITGRPKNGQKIKDSKK